MSTLNQLPIDQPSSLAISKYNEEFISLADRVTSKLRSLDTSNSSPSEANAKQLAQNNIKKAYELLVQADDILKAQLGSLNGVPEQIDVTSEESVGPLSIDTGIEEIPLFNSVIQNRYRIKPLNRPIPIQQIKPINSRPIQPILQNTRLYIGNNTVNVMKEEVLALGLPSTLSDISLAIQSSEKVLNSFVNHDGILLVPAEVQATRRDVFKNVCYSLVCRGDTTLNSWNEVEEKLAEVFLFFRTYYIPSPMNRQATTRPLGRPLRLRNINSHQQRGSTMNASCLSISAYKQMMKKKMGASKFEQIFNHAEALTTTKKPTAIKSYDEFAKDIDDQIKQNEEIDRQDQIREE